MMKIISYIIAFIASIIILQALVTMNWVAGMLAILLLILAELSEINEKVGKK